MKHSHLKTFPWQEPAKNLQPLPLSLNSFLTALVEVRQIGVNLATKRQRLSPHVLGYDRNLGASQEVGEVFDEGELRPNK